MEPSDLKDELRREVRGAIGLMTGEAKGAASDQICGLLMASGWVREAGCLMVFEALGDEPDLTALASAALAGGKTVCYPRIDWERRVLSPIAVETHAYPRAAFRHGVKEPTEGREVAPEELDLVIVPGVAFDARGARLGRGGGYYDRFLGELLEKVEIRVGRRAHAVGVCFDCQRVERVVMEAHDVCVDAVVTEKGVFHGLE